MDGPHVRYVIRPALGQRNNMVCLVAAWLSAHMTDSLVFRKNVFCSALLR